MKILLVVHGFPPECSGGTESYVLALAKELIALDHRVEVVTGSHEGRPERHGRALRARRVLVHKIHRSGLFVDNWDKSYAPEIEPRHRRACSRRSARPRPRPPLDPALAPPRRALRTTAGIRVRLHAARPLDDVPDRLPVRDGSFCERPAGGDRATTARRTPQRRRRPRERRGARALPRGLPERARAREAGDRSVARAPRRGARRTIPRSRERSGSCPTGPSARSSPTRRNARSSDREDPRRPLGPPLEAQGIDILLEAAASLPAARQGAHRAARLRHDRLPGEKPDIEALARKAGAITARPVRAGRPRVRAPRPRGDPDALQRIALVRARRGVPARPPGDRPAPRRARRPRSARPAATFKPEDPGRSRAAASPTSSSSRRP